jgi:hypothetical protein
MHSENKAMDPFLQVRTGSSLKVRVTPNGNASQARIVATGYRLDKGSWKKIWNHGQLSPGPANYRFASSGGQMFKIVLDCQGADMQSATVDGEIDDSDDTLDQHAEPVVLRGQGAASSVTIMAVAG